MTTPTALPTPTARRVLSVLGTLLAALLCALGLGATPASAHAALTSTDPANGSVVQTAPQRITLRFSEGVMLNADSIRVLDPGGERVEQGGPEHVDGKSDSAAVALRAGLARGTYTVAWQAVSADSHPVAGAFTFSIGAPSKTTVKATATVTEVDPAVEVLYDAGRYAAYAGFVLLVGGCVFAGVCRSSRSVQRIAVGGWITLFASTAALLLLRGAYTSGKGTGDVLDLALLGDVLATKPGAALLSRLLLLSAAAVFLAVLFGSYAREDDDRTRGERRDVAYGLGIGGTVVAVGLAATWAMAEHASVGIQAWLAMPVDVVHLVAVAVWLGGLAALLAALRSGEPLKRAAVVRFSRLAFASVCALVATGLYQSWRQVGSWDALTGTSYGRWLLVKAGLVIVLVGVAYFSRRWTARLTDGPEPKRTKSAKPAAQKVTAAAKGGGADSAERAAQLARQRAALEKAAGKRERDADENRSGLRRSVGAEAAVAVVLLAVTTVLTGTQPGRAEAEQQRAASGAAAPAATGPAEARIPYDTGGTNGRGTARITLDPGRSGRNTLDVAVTDAAGRPVDVPELEVSFTEKAKEIGPLRATLERRPGGRWQATGFQLPMAGEWQLSLTVRTSDIDQVTEIKNVKIN
ncbi:Copper transport protein YcnJ precursor [Streptomyces netropsis]|uniref:Copper transport protein n=1 Tax=Streptomyces syringium TaxID=76729 RepID=A0ABS4Y5H7_9ACTN|nr:copper resistance protein CopC [Streptomyces syringium]MBP2404043.1 copper transport protein [Streptomyces syringium]SPE53765.1 Copper transport protein YcnJ precursor [Streptomyces netropsis]